MWHPTERGTVLTCSEDGTLRVWDVGGEAMLQKTVIKPQVCGVGAMGGWGGGGGRGGVIRRPQPM